MYFLYNKYSMRKILVILLFFPLIGLSQPNTVLYNITSDTVLNGSLDCEEVSIASISKLMTVYTVLKSKQNLTEKLTVRSNKTPNTKLSKGMILTRLELINLSLISSDNIAAITLSENYPNGRVGFVTKMNEYAKELSMMHSGFVEPTGLSPMNYSTIGDIITLTKAVSEFDIVQSAAQSQRTFAPIETKKRKKPIKEPKRKPQVVANNPTSSYFGREGIITIKTGFTSAAGFCITLLVKANDQLYNITVLGAKSKQERQRLVEKSLAKIYSA